MIAPQLHGPGCEDVRRGLVASSSTVLGIKDRAVGRQAGADSVVGGGGNEQAGE